MFSRLTTHSRPTAGYNFWKMMQRRRALKHDPVRIDQNGSLLPKMLILSDFHWHKNSTKWGPRSIQWSWVQLVIHRIDWSRWRSSKVAGDHQPGRQVFLWTRWGRVGVAGQSNLSLCGSQVGEWNGDSRVALSGCLQTWSIMDIYTYIIYVYIYVFNIYI